MQTMERRSILALLASGASGCITHGSSVEQEQSIPEGAEEPPKFPEADEIIYPAFSGGRVEMTASPQESELPKADIEFRVTNSHPNVFETNFHDWRMHTLVGGEWWFLGVFAPFETIDNLKPTESHTWEVTVDNDVLGTPAEQLAPSARSSFTVAGLGTGVYTFSCVGEFHGNDTTIAVVTPFVLSGEDVDLAPAANVETTRNGDTLRVNETGSESREHQIAATRRTPTGSATRLAPEWGLRQPGIRNTVPFLSGGIQKVVFSRSQPMVRDGKRIDGATFVYRDVGVEFNLTER